MFLDKRKEVCIVKKAMGAEPRGRVRKRAICDERQVGWVHTDGWRSLGQEVSWNEVRKARQASGPENPFCSSYLLSLARKGCALLDVCVLRALDACVSLERASSSHPPSSDQVSHSPGLSLLGFLEAGARSRGWCVVGVLSILSFHRELFM